MNTRPDAESTRRAGLESAPFAVSLRRAIADRGLPLNELCRRLAEHQVRVSVATLSMWQSGRRAPQSTSSLRVVGALEEILDVPPNSLWDLLSVPTKIGKTIGHTIFQDIPGTPTAFEDALAEVDLLGVSELDEISVQVTGEVGKTRRMEKLTYLSVFRANRQGAQRTVSFIVADGPLAAAPKLSAVAGCTIGRQALRLADGVAVTELILPTPLARNATAVVEWQAEVPEYPVEDVDWYCIPVTGRVPQATLMVRFANDCHPTAGEAFCMDAADVEINTTPQSVRNGLHNIAHDFGPGKVGVRWWWNES